MNDGQIPVTVIGGYLGAGKTTLLNHMLRKNGGVRVAVFVNDFGSINIDADLIENRDGETIALTNGCICCSLASGFGTAMLAIRESESPPERVVVEASGIGDPLTIAQYAHLPGFRLDGVIVLVDASTVRQRVRDRYVGQHVLRQLRGADLLLLNKIDLISNEDRTNVRTWLGDVAPGVSILDVERADVPVEVLFGDIAVQNAESDGKPFSEQDGTRELQHERYETWSFTSARPLDEARIRAAIAGLGADVLRGKGILYLAHDPAVKFIFQRVGKGWSIEAGEAWGANKPNTQLILIGLAGSIDRQALDVAFMAALH